jgi:DNA-directed RNA polymerase subunit omega
MARITVEDCLGSCREPFRAGADRRAPRPRSGAGREALVPWENDKPTVVALRELAEGKIDHLIQEKYRQMHAAPKAESPPAAHNEPSPEPGLTAPVFNLIRRTRSC